MLLGPTAVPAQDFPYILKWKRLVGTPPPESVIEAGPLSLFAEADGTIVAVRRQDGLRQWHVRPGGPVGGGLAVDADRVYLADRWGGIRALELTTGAPVWSMRRTGWGDSRLAVAGARVLVTGGDGVLYCLDAATGLEHWRLRTGLRPHGGPAVSAGRVFTATADRQLLAIELDSGHRIHQIGIEATARYVTVIGDRLWVAGSGAITRYDGDLERSWSRWLGTELTTDPVEWREQLICAGANGYVYALSLQSGETVWKVDLGHPAEQLTTGTDHLTLTTEDGALIALDGTGAVSWFRQIGSGTVARVSVGQGRLYVSAGGQLRAFDSARPSTAASDTIWWEGFSRGVKTGYGWQLWSVADGALVLQSYRVGWRHGFVQLRSLVRLQDEEFTPLLVEREKVEASQVLLTRMTRSGDSLHIERRLGTSSEEWTLPLPTGTIVVDAVAPWLRRRGLRPGRDTVLVLDTDDGTIRPLMLSTGAADASGRIRVDMRYAGPVSPPPPAAEDLSPDRLTDIDLVMWLDEEGRPWQIEAPALGSLERRVPADTARAWLAPGPERTLRLDMPVVKPDRLDSIRLAFPESLGDVRGLFVEDGRQELRTDSTGTSLLVRRQALPERTLPIADLTRRQELHAYLQPSLYIQSEAADIQRIAADLVPDGEGTDSWAASRLIHDWVYDHMVPAHTNVRFKSSLEVLEDLEGTCSEYTVLFAALARAAGIPTRVTVGFAIAAEGQLVLHIWPQVYVGEWVEVDPSWNAFPVEAAHIKTGQGLLHPAHLQRLNMPLEWITANADSLFLLAFGGGGGPPFTAWAEALYRRAQDADRLFEEEATQAARYELVALPWNHRSGSVLIDIARYHLTRGELDEAAWALDRLRRQDPTGPEADAAMFYQARLEEKRDHPGEARQLLEMLVQRFPEGDWADDALGALAEIVEKSEGCSRARPYYERLTEVYAASGWASVARSARRRCDESEAPPEPGGPGS